MKVKALSAHLEMLPQDASIYFLQGNPGEDQEVVQYNEQTNSVIIYYNIWKDLPEGV